MLEEEYMLKCGYDKIIERWGCLEVTVTGKSEGNPFADYTVTGIFESDREQITANGFYDGNGCYKVRFMPSYEGSYQFKIFGTFSDEVDTGSFQVTAPASDNHGPVRVQDEIKLFYEDNTPYQSYGTTCYVWALQDEELQKQTLETLKNSPFNKIRFCVFPKHYVFNFNEPYSYPYEGTPCDSKDITEENFMEYGKEENVKNNHWDFSRFNPEHFTHLEQCIKELMKLGIEADIILLHPYDRWGFSRMGLDNENFYLKYVVSRFSAYRNVWWSMANEYDVFPDKPLSDWEENAKIVCRYDPYLHLRSIHNCIKLYDFTRPWITHCSIQRTELYRSAELTDEWIRAYHKPVVLDEICYEGDISYAWGNISGEEMTRRFWQAAMRGGYAGHGETYLGHDNHLWWSHGGKLYGDSPKRIRFLSDIMKEVPGGTLSFSAKEWDDTAGTTGEGYTIYYYDRFRPSFRDFNLDKDKKYKVDVIDTWNMTVSPAGVFSGKFRIPLPGREYMAIRIVETDNIIE